LPSLNRSLATPPAVPIGLLNPDRGASSFETEPDSIRRILVAVREHMGMEIAYISEFVTRSACEIVVFRGVDAPGFEQLLEVGACKAREDTYCHHVMSGDLPGLMTDTALYPLAQSLAATHAMPIRAHIGVPIYLSDGAVYGMLCCTSSRTDPTLTDRDMQVMRVFADRAGDRERRIQVSLSADFCPRPASPGGIRGVVPVCA
jgi:GAF domain-containing protein